MENDLSGRVETTSSGIELADGTRRRFTAEFKAQAVKRLLEGGKGLSAVASWAEPRPAERVAAALAPSLPRQGASYGGATSSPLAAMPVSSCRPRWPHSVPGRWVVECTLA